jgi:15-cis-phytoene synthase / lycopene beta-cyclase
MHSCKSSSSPSIGLTDFPRHVKFTILPAVVLTVLIFPFLTRFDTVKIAFITAIAFVSTLPWDAYLIRRGIWTYPDDAVFGATLLGIPLEECFFFIIQTYLTSLIYILFNKPILHAQYVQPLNPSIKGFKAWLWIAKNVVTIALLTMTARGWNAAVNQKFELGKETYLTLILVWAGPFVCITWIVSGGFLLLLPWTATVLPVVIPTIYLWCVDELALRKGVWVIERGTKLDVQLFGNLDVEEAIFFLVTNILVVFGLASLDLAAAINDAFPSKFPEPSDRTGLKNLLRALFSSPFGYDMPRVVAIQEAVARLKRKSRSFYLASGVFPDRLRIDMTLLYVARRNPA